MPSASRARLIISYRSPAVKGFSPVWLYCAEPIPTMISSCVSRIRRTVARWPRWNGWNRPMKKALPLTPHPLRGSARCTGTRASGTCGSARSGRPLARGPGPDSARSRAWLVRGHLGDESRKLADQPGLLRADEGLFEHLAQRVNRDDLDLSLVFVLEQDVFEVRSGNHDLLDPEFRGRLDLRRDAADGQDLPADAQRARHRDRLADRDFLEGADHRRGDGDRGAVALRPFPRADELHVDVMIRDVFARVLLDQGGDVLDGLFRDLPEAARGDDPSALLRLGRRDLRRDWEDDPAELRDRVVADEHREAVHHPHDRAFRDERLVLLAAFNHSVCDLLFEGPRDALCVEDVLRRDERRALFLRDVARDPNEAAELAQPEGELAAPT